MILGNSLHMVVVKKKMFEWLAIPISVNLFGENKTLRGFVILPILAGLLALLGSNIWGPFIDTHINDLLIGIGLGGSFMLGELPNSFVKRSLGIKNGEYSEKFRTIQMFFDRADSLIGIFIFYYLVTDIRFIDVIILFSSAMILSFITSIVLVKLKIKKGV
jgi:CDP-diglyceride synthetase